MLNQALAALPVAEAEISIPWNWRIGPAPRPMNDESYVARSFTPAGAGLRPFSVVHIEQPWRKARSPGNLNILWTRRSRALAADSWGGLDVPLAEEAEAYEVEIMDGAVVKRTLATGTTSVTYSGSQQIADWGALLGPGDTLDVRIHQLSALVEARLAENRHLSLRVQCPTPAPISCFPTSPLRRRRSTSPTTRRCDCSTGSSSLPCLIAT